MHKIFSLFFLSFCKSKQSRSTPLNLASSSVSTNNHMTFTNNSNDDQIQWPTLYSTMETMSLNESHRKISSLMSMPNYNKQTDREDLCSTNSLNARYGNNTFNFQDHKRKSYQQRFPTNNNFHRQTSVTPRIMSSLCNDNQASIQSLSTYFGSGSNIGRGRPMTNDR